MTDTDAACESNKGARVGDAGYDPVVEAELWYVAHFS
jgi:hypothetical protein